MGKGKAEHIIYIPLPTVLYLVVLTVLVHIESVYCFCSPYLSYLGFPMLVYISGYSTCLVSFEFFNYKFILSS